MSNIDKLSGYETIPPQAKNFPIKIRRYSLSGGLTPHWHEHLELLFFLDGCTTLIVNGKALEVGAGDTVAVNSTEVHSFTVAGERAEYLCLIIYPDFFSDIEFDGITIENFIPSDAYATECAEAIYREYSRGGALCAMRQKAMTYTLISHLAEKYQREPMTRQSQKRRTAALSRLDLVTEYVSMHYSEHLTTKDLAGICYLSESHFCRFFKAATGKSALEYISEYRAERAAVLLKNTDISISEIAESVGFDDQNYFSRIFKRVKGVTPKEYRAAGVQV